MWLSSRLPLLRDSASAAADASPGTAQLLRDTGYKWSASASGERAIHQEAPEPPHRARRRRRRVRLDVHLAASLSSVDLLKARSHAASGTGRRLPPNSQGGSHTSEATTS